MNRPTLINPNEPTQQEIIEHNTKIAKANFCTGMAIALAGNTGLDLGGATIAERCITCAEAIFNRYSMTALGNSQNSSNLPSNLTM